MLWSVCSRPHTRTVFILFSSKHLLVLVPRSSFMCSLCYWFIPCGFLVCVFLRFCNIFVLSLACLSVASFCRPPFLLFAVLDFGFFGMLIKDLFLFYYLPVWVSCMWANVRVGPKYRELFFVDSRWTDTRSESLTGVQLYSKPGCYAVWDFTQR